MEFRRAVRRAVNAMGFDIHRIENATSLRQFRKDSHPTTLPGARRGRSTIRGSDKGA